MKLDLKKVEYENVSMSGVEYKQDFPNGYIRFFLSKTPTSTAYNKVNVEFGADYIGDYNQKYRAWDSKWFATAEAFDRGKTWAEMLINKYESILMEK